MRNELLRHQLYKLEEITTMENDGVDFTVDIPDTFLFRFAALVLTPTVQEATADGGEQHPDEDDIDQLSIQLYPPINQNRSQVRRQSRPPTCRASFRRQLHILPGRNEHLRLRILLPASSASAPAPTASSASSALTAGWSLSACSASSARAPSILGVLGVPAHGWQIVAPVMICFRKQ